MLPERFWQKVNKNGPTPATHPKLGPCWLWLGGKTKNGYGQWNRGQGCRTPQLTHKTAYGDAYTKVPSGLELDHLCRVRSCCNPLHLEPVTRHENIMRGVRLNALKTHCPQGHSYTATNTYTQRNPGGTTSRKCRTCAAAAVRRHRSAL